MNAEPPLEPGDTIRWGHALAEPQTPTEPLVEQRASPGGVRCFSGQTASDAIRPEHGDHLSSVPYRGSGCTVTEHGSADLCGLTLGRRPARMLTFAHPDHRPLLEEECTS
jgi:hypothetical protein